MYKSFYGLSCNPFLKDESVKYEFQSKDFLETINRLNYLKEIKGIGLFTGTSGLGKTFSLRFFINSLNRDLYKVIYINPSPNMTVFDFFKQLSNELNLDTGSCYGIDLYKNIQKEIKRLVNGEKINPIVIIDDAHLLSREIIFNFKVLYDFEMDSKDYVALILTGYPDLKIELSKNIHETLNQRIIVNYEFNGLTREEVKEYVKTRLEIASAEKNIFTEEALNALYSCCKSSPRRLNTLVLNSLMLGCQEKVIEIDSEIIMRAKKEMDLK